MIKEIWIKNTKVPAYLSRITWGSDPQVPQVDQLQMFCWGKKVSILWVTAIMGFFNKTSMGFIMRFALILSVSFVILFAVNFYVLNSEEPQVAKPTNVSGH